MTKTHRLMVGNLLENNARLKRIFIEPTLPKDLSPLMDLAHNLWWSWNHRAIALFDMAGPGLMEQYNYNPIALLEHLSMEQANRLIADKQFMRLLKEVYGEFKQYMEQVGLRKGSQIAYFCMEYGLHQSIRLYSGGLGVLAGDYLKEAGDRNFNLVAVGLLYRYGYFQQGISLNGEQLHLMDAAKFTQLPLSPVRDSKEEWVKIHINLAGRTVWAKVWELKVGRVSLYLLDTDIDDNLWEDRSLTHQLYGGDNEHRLKQELLLGIGGLRALKAIGVDADAYHLNEGHAAFLGLERLRNYMKDKKLSYEAALEVVRSTQLFTTHTPVPAGHDNFPEALLRDYLFEYTYALDISWERLVALGRANAADTSEPFSVSHLALRTSQESNGVSRLHGEVSRKMFAELHPDYHYAESNIGHVTNSVHFYTWVAGEWLDFYRSKLGKGFEAKQSDPKQWAKIMDVAPEEIMAIRRVLKSKLLNWVKSSLNTDYTRRGENPRSIFEITNSIREDALVIGFARRFATYKRATLLFSNEQRLAEIVNNADRPVIFLFAGKAHPADKHGQEFIRFIYNTTKNPLFKGKVIFLENYSMEMAKLLVQGVDIWLNTPTRPLEASGTSGMKAVMNGVMNFSVLDGWWCEGYRPGAGWALPEKSTYEDPTLQNELDAETIYNILENDIVPTYYDQDEKGISLRWVSHIKKTIAEIVPSFVMGRMLDDYEANYYSKLYASSKSIKGDQLKNATELVAWKNRVRRIWDAIELKHLEAPDTFNHSFRLGTDFKAAVTLNIQELQSKDIGVELVFFRRKSETELDLLSVHPLMPGKQHGTDVTYSCDMIPSQSGVFEYGFRMYPTHPLLVHRQDFGLVRWL